MKNKTIILFLMSLALLFTACEKQNDEAEKEIITSVKTEILQPATLHRILKTNGNVRAESSIDVYPVVTGRVVKSNINLGKKISKGDLIAVIDPSVTGGNYSLYEVRSPIDGTVLSNSVHTGEIATSDTKLAVIGDLSSLKIISYVSEPYFGSLNSGLKADVFTEAFPDETFHAKIKFFSPVIDEESRTCEVTLVLTDKNPKIVAGMFADLSIYLNTYENQFSLPSQCISYRNGEAFVLTVSDDNKVVSAKVETGLELSDRTIIKSGLANGDQVITEGYETLSDGMSVKVISTSVYGE